MKSIKIRIWKNDQFYNIKRENDKGELLGFVYSGKKEEIVNTLQVCIKGFLDKVVGENNNELIITVKSKKIPKKIKSK